MAMDMQRKGELCWRQLIEAGELGLWDLRPDLETVHHSPQWKQRLGFPDPGGADSTHFWRCRGNERANRTESDTTWQFSTERCGLRYNGHGDPPSAQAERRGLSCLAMNRLPDRLRRS